MRLTDFSVLTFDCYGTLIDWESGIFTALGPLLTAADRTLSRDAALEIFARHEADQEQRTPGMIYSDLLTAVHRRMADELKISLPETVHLAFGASVPKWPAFADSAASLQYLKQHYKLVILSNVDRASFAGSNERLGVTFDAVYTAQDVGSYKPDVANFHYMLDHLAKLDVTPAGILHTAQSLFHDHGPAKKIGLASCWIDRRHDNAGWGATMPPSADAAYDFSFPSMAAFVKAHQEDLGRV